MFKSWWSVVLVLLLAAGCTARASGGLLASLDGGAAEDTSPGEDSGAGNDVVNRADIQVTFDGSGGSDVVFQGCSVGLTDCGGACTNVMADNLNCGFCGNACGPGQRCLSGMCATSCTFPTVACFGVCANTQSDTANCGSCAHRCNGGYTCAGGVCQPPTSTATVGSPCVVDANCGTGGACISSGAGFPGGYCVYGCAAGAMAGATCGPGTGICLMAGTALECFPECTPGSTGGCRSGYGCQSVTTDNSQGDCVPHCAADPGAVCGASQCDSSTGLCSGACTTVATCSAGSTCDTATMVCDCGSSTDCGPNARCYPATATTSPLCGCTSNAYCSPGHTCNLTTGSCM